MKFLCMICAFVVVFTAGFDTAGAQLKILERPIKYKQPIDDVDLLPSPAEGRIRLKKWFVFSDRENNQTFTTSGGTQPKKLLHFMEDFFVVEEIGEFVHLVKDSAPALDLSISSAAQDYGWIDKKNLLLWTHCLVTAKSRISKKGMILNTIEHLQGEDKGKPDVVDFLLEPRENGKSSGQHSGLFEIFFVLKTTDKYYLLAKNERMQEAKEEDRRSIVVGWAPKNRVTPWDHRKAIEPNWDKVSADERRNGKRAVILYDELAARKYRDGENLDENQIVWDSDPFEKRNRGQWRRFPGTAKQGKRGYLLCWRNGLNLRSQCGARGDFGKVG